MAENKGVIPPDNGTILAADQPVPFTYPEGFNAMAESLQFLPDEATRVQVLKGLVGALFAL